MAPLSPLWGARGVGCSSCGGRGPYAAGRAGNTRGDKFRVRERGLEQDRITGGTGAAPFVAGNLPADRQVRSSRPPKDPQEEHPTPLAPVTTTFATPEASVFVNWRYRTSTPMPSARLLRQVRFGHLPKGQPSRDAERPSGISISNYGRPQAQ